MSKIRFTDLVSFVGTTPTRFEGEKTYISTGAVDSFAVSESELENVSFNNRPSRANLSVIPDTIIFAKMAETLKTLQIDDELSKCIFSTGFCAVQAKRAVITPRCLYYLVSSPTFLSQKDKHASGATQRAITNSGMANIYIEVPPLDKQPECTRKLDILTEAINKSRAQLEKIDKLVKSQFIEMFGTIAKNEKGFPLVAMNEACIKITDGKHGGCSFQDNSGFYFVGAREIFDDEIHYASASQISEEDFYKDYKRCDLTNGDLVIVNTGATIGKTAIASSSLTSHTLLQKSVAIVRTKKEQLLPIFLKYCYSANPDMYRVSSASAQPNLLLSRMKSTRIYLPPIELQNEFARFVEQTDKSKNVYELEVAA